MNIIFNHQANSIPKISENKPFKDTVSKKTQQVAFQALFWVAWTFITTLAIATVIPIAVVITQRVGSHVKLRDTIQAIAKKRYSAVQNALVQMSTNDMKRDSAILSGSDAERTWFFRHLFSLTHMMRKEALPPSGVHAYMQKFRSKLDKLLASEIYQNNRDRVGNHWIKALQTLAHVLVSDSPGMEPMQALGKSVVGEIGEDINYERLSQILKNSVKREAVFKRGTVCGKVFWTCAHPQKGLISACDHIGLEDPLKYNSYEHGNASIQIGHFKARNVTYSLSQAPTATCDKLVDAARESRRQTDHPRH